MKRASVTRVWLLTAVIASVFGTDFRGIAQSAPPVFPGAVGFGTQTRAAYGGSTPPTVYRVTNLNDSGAGSLRAALTATGPRVVIFEVSGTISLSNPINVVSPYLTVAGQTAPSPGITIRNQEILIRTNDVLVQHIRIRSGDSPLRDDKDAATIADSSAYNVVIDHVSLSWAIDENFGLSYGPVQNVTLSNTIMSEGLRVGGHSMNLLVAPRAKNVSMIRNLLASADVRNFFALADTRTYFANNLVYNWGTDATFLGNLPDYSLPPLFATVVGNHYRRGPSTASTAYALGVRYLTSASAIYLADNLRDGANISESVVGGWPVDGVLPRVTTPPVTVSGFTPIPSSQVQSVVLANAGARPADRDAVDTRVVGEVVARTGQIPRSQNDVGGWPTLAVNVRALTLPTNPHSYTSSGYTNLELWLHNFAAGVEGGATATEVPSAPTGVHITSQ
jgi:pectate lyase